MIQDRIPALLPPDVSVIHKTGNLTGVLHDAGIVAIASGSAVVVAMSQAIVDLDKAFSIEQRIGLAAYQVVHDAAPSDATPTN